MLKLKLWYFGHLMRRADSLENTLMLGMINGRREEVATEDEMFGWQHWLNGRAAAAKSHQLCLTLCDLMDCSLPGSSVHGILQARELEWVAIAFSAIAMRLSKLQETVKDREACVLQSMGLWKVEYDFATEQQQPWHNHLKSSAHFVSPQTKITLL